MWPAGLSGARQSGISPGAHVTGPCMLKGSVSSTCHGRLAVVSREGSGLITTDGTWCHQKRPGRWNSVRSPVLASRLSSWGHFAHRSPSDQEWERGADDASGTGLSCLNTENLLRRGPSGGNVTLTAHSEQRTFLSPSARRLLSDLITPTSLTGAVTGARETRMFFLEAKRIRGQTSELCA